MTGMVLRRIDLIRLARQRLVLGARLRCQHHADGVGCCARCGRPYPCRAVSLGDALIRHYSQVLRRHSGTPPTGSTQPGTADVVSSFVETDDAAR